MSRIAITGSSGLIGTALRRRLAERGDELVRVFRGNPSDPSAAWDPAAGWVREGALDGIDAVVHLAGDAIGEGRWNARRKASIRSSRVDATRLLVDHLAKLPRRPAAFIAASAIGYYGDRGDEILTEASPPGDDFLAGVVREWERESLRAAEHGMRAATLRIGIVLAKEGGALPRMLLPFRFGAGGPLGNGRQWWSWVALEDVVGAILFALEQDLRGAVNVVAPGAARNREVAKALGRVLHRPSLLPAPAFALRLLLGETANALLFASQRVVPERLTAAGYTFVQRDLEGALRAALGR